MEEQLGELIAMARHVGYLQKSADHAEHLADMAPKGSTARPRREARELRTLYEVRLKRLDDVKAACIKRWGWQ